MKLCISVLISAVFALSSTVAFPQSSKEKCVRAAQAELAQCQKGIPANPKPKDPKNLTSSEKGAMAKHTQAWKACNDKGAKAAGACK